MEKMLFTLNYNITNLIENNRDKSWTGLRAATYQSVTAELKRCNKNFTLSTLCKMADYLDTDICILLNKGDDQR